MRKHFLSGLVLALVLSMVTRAVAQVDWVQSLLVHPPASPMAEDATQMILGNWTVSPPPDLSVAAGGIPFVFSRTYQHQDQEASPVSPGWTHSYRMSYTVTPDHAIWLSWGDGRQERYVSVGDHRYQPPPGVANTLMALPTGGVRVMTPQHLTYTFTRRTATTGVLQAITDPDGHRMSFRYDKAGLLVAVVDAAKRTYRFQYDASGHLVKVQDFTQRAVSLAYDAAGRLTKVTDPAGRSTAYGYDAVGRLVSIQDALGREVVHTTYDAWGAWGRMDTQTVGDTERRYSYDEDQMIMRVTQNGATTTSQYDPQTGQILRQVDADAHATRWTYDARGFVQAVTDADGHTTTYTRDAWGHATSITDALGHVTRFTYDPRWHQPTALVDAAGHRTTLQYDAHGHLTAVTNVLHQTTRLQYDHLGRVAGLTNPLGATWHLAYNGAGLVTAVHDPLGAKTVFQRDALGRVTALVDALGHATQAQYDPGDVVTALVDALHRQTTYQYDANGQLVSTTDPLQRTITSSYDLLGRLVRQTDALGLTTERHYNADDRLTAFTNARGATTTWTYSPTGEMVLETDPLSRSQGTTYTATGQVASTTDASGTSLKYSYDAAGEVIQKQYPDGTSIQYTYDLTGAVSAIQDRQGGLTRYRRDALERIVEETQPDGTTIRYAYDAAGQLARLTYPSGRVVKYAYDRAGRLVGMTDAKSQVGVRYAYDLAGRRQKLAYVPNGVIGKYLYDAANQLLSITYTRKGTPLSSFHYSYDAGGRRTAAQETTPAGKHLWSYGYDANDQLTSVTRDGQPWSTYSYDANGNRLTKTDPQGKITYTYDTADELTHLTDPAGDMLFTYSPDGDTLTRSTLKGATQYAYNEDHLLQQVQENKKSLVSYQYDALGRRVGRTPASGPATKTVWSGWEYLAEETSGAPPTEYAPNGSLASAFWISQGQPQYPMTDALGSVRGVTNPQGQLISHADFDEFGSPLGPATLGPGYTGQMADVMTNLLYLRNRDYGSEIGRFFRKDSLIYLTSPNLYVYVNNNPNTYVDPTGQSPLDAAISIGTFIFNPTPANAAYAGIDIITIAYPIPSLNTAIKIINGVATAGAVLNGSEQRASDQKLEDAERALQAAKARKAAAGAAGAAPPEPPIKPSDLKKLTQKEIKNIGGEKETAELKKQVGKSEVDIYKDKSGNLWGVRKDKTGSPIELEKNIHDYPQCRR